MNILHPPGEDEMNRLSQAAEFLEQREDGQQLAAEIWCLLGLLHELRALSSEASPDLESILQAITTSDEKKLGALLSQFNDKVNLHATSAPVPEVPRDQEPTQT